MIADLDTLLTALYVELTDRIIPSRGFTRSRAGRQARGDRRRAGVHSGGAGPAAATMTSGTGCGSRRGLIGHLFPRLLCQGEYNARLAIRT